MQETLPVELKKMSALDMLSQKLCSWKWPNPKISHDHVTIFMAWTDDTSPYTLRGRCKVVGRGERRRGGEGRKEEGRGGEKSAKGKRERQSFPSLSQSPLFFCLHSPPLLYRRLPRRIITIRYNTYLSQTFLSSPYWSVDDFEEKLSCARIEDKNGTVDWFRGQVTFERLKWKRRGMC